MPADFYCGLLARPILIHRSDPQPGGSLGSREKIWRSTSLFV